MLGMPMAAGGAFPYSSMLLLRAASWGRCTLLGQGEAGLSCASDAAPGTEAGLGRAGHAESQEGGCGTTRKLEAREDGLRAAVCPGDEEGGHHAYRDSPWGAGAGRHL